MSAEFDGIVPTAPRDYLTQQHIMRYIFASSFVKGKSTLDIACGSGYGANYLGLTAEKVVGADFSENALQYAHDHYKGSTLYFVQASALHLPFADHSFDVVVSFETIEHLREYQQYLKEIKRVLTSKGLFICSTPNISYTQHPYYHLKEFHADEFFCLLEQHFESVDRFGQFISLFARVRDVLRFSQRFSLMARQLASRFPQPFKALLKSMRKVLTPVMDEPYHITEEDALSFSEHSVIQLHKKSRSDLLRIMVAVCRCKRER